MSEKILGLMNTHNCGELTVKHIGDKVTLCGWVNKYRNLGGLHFIDVRDKHGLTQLGFENFRGDISKLKEVALEGVVKASGTVIARPSEAKNLEMKTGEIEISVDEFEILSNSDKDRIPFLPFAKIEATEDLRLKYRYLDLRTERLQSILKKRSDTTIVIRNFMALQDFVEVETPILYKSTPEGARDYVVPSRVHPGTVYALPQSPQTLKQLLMIGGTGKYFQIAKCFRDEDLRADRQPEFTQVDIEVSFATQDYLRNLMTALMPKIFAGLPADFKFPVMSFDQAMNLYGTDKPDISFDLPHIDVTSLFRNSSFQTFADAACNGLIKAIFVPATTGTFTRKEVDAFVDVVKPFGGKGVAWFKVAGSEVSGGISKFIDGDLLAKMQTLSKESSSNDGTWLFVAGKESIVHASADALRRHIGKSFKLSKSGYHFLWVNDFPLYEWNEDDKRFYARHHPFTAPKTEDLPLYLSGEQASLAKCRAEAYDLVCNGYEIAGGSIRIHRQDVQAKMFEYLGMGEEETKNQFGFFLEALKYGTPPHGGMALGLDRTIMLIVGTDNIRDVIAFPKTTSATDLMASAPSSPSPAQIKELHFSWNK